MRCDSCALVLEAYREFGIFNICTECMNKEFEFWLNLGWEPPEEWGDWSSQDSVYIPVLHGIPELKNPKPMTPLQELYVRDFNNRSHKEKKIKHDPLSETLHNYRKSHNLFKNGFVVEVSGIRYNK
jgi:hypothetical protein